MDHSLWSFTQQSGPSGEDGRCPPLLAGVLRSGCKCLHRGDWCPAIPASHSLWLAKTLTHLRLHYHIHLNESLSLCPFHWTADTSLLLLTLRRPTVLMWTLGHQVDKPTEFLSASLERCVSQICRQGRRISLKKRKLLIWCVCEEQWVQVCLYPTANGSKLKNKLYCSPPVTM